MARHHRPPLSAMRRPEDYQRSDYRAAIAGGQRATTMPPRKTSPVETPAAPTQPAPVELPNDLKGKTDFFPEASWRNALVEHLQGGRVAQARNQLNNWRRNGDHSKQCLRLLCAGESQHTIQDINFGLFTPQDFECVSLRGITFRRSVFPEGGEAFKESLEARGASFAGYRIGQQNYVPSTANAPAPQGKSPAR